jgi:hypothetical protein
VIDINNIGRFNRPILFVSLIATLGLLLALQGWRSRVPTFDLVPHIDDAQGFIIQGEVPKRGTLTSFASYTPPGTTWLIVPGVYFFRDPRLFQSIGTSVLYVGTLLGIFLLANEYLGIGCALLAVTLWGLSQLGLHFGNSLWPRGHPGFYVWMVYWAGKWVERKNSAYLAAAITIWAVGMYVFMEIAPALFLLLAIWVHYRPPLRIRPLIIAGISVGVIWYPYLQFEAGRRFVDLRSQMFRQQIWPADFKGSWCNPSLVPASWEATPASLTPAAANSAGSADTRGTALGNYLQYFAGRTILNDTLDSNFKHNSLIPGASTLLLWSTIIGLSFLSLGMLRTGEKKRVEHHIRWFRAAKWLGPGMVVTAVLVNEISVARYLSDDGVLAHSTVRTVRTLQAVLALAGIVLLMLRNNGPAIAYRLIHAIERDKKGPAHAKEGGVLVISLIVPWLILLFITEPDRLERFWWLWPLQIIALASVVTYIPLQLKLPRLSIWLGSILLLLALGSNSLLIERVSGWIQHGWSGPDAEEIKVVDYIARQLNSQGQNRAAIGYDIYVYQFMATLNPNDRRYKVGADFDLLFKYRHGILNRNQCPEGVSSEDEYRIVQTSTDARDEAARRRIDVPGDDGFRLAQRFGSHQVLQHH